MKKYVIVGNGVAGTEAALELRRRLGPKEAEITLVSEETPYFFSRTALMYAFMDRMDRQDLEPYERRVYEGQKIRRIQDRVVNLNADEGEIILHGGERLGFDGCLLATGASPRRIDFAGYDKVMDGVVTFVSMQDLDACERLTRTSEAAVVVGGGLIGIELVECFVHHGLKVTFLVREPYFWPAALEAEEGELISAHIRSHGVDLRHGEELAGVDVDSSGAIQEVQTANGESLKAQILGLCVGVLPSVEWLREVDTPPELSRGVVVDSTLKSSLDGVFAAGDCAEVHFADGRPPFHQPIWYTARDQGILAARSMMGDSVTYEPPIFYNSSKFFDVEYTTVGSVRDLPEGTASLYRWKPSGRSVLSQRIYFRADDEQEVLAFSMLGSRWDHGILIRWIKERRSLKYVQEHLARAQFDVEFGRAPLARMEEKEFVH